MRATCERGEERLLFVTGGLEGPAREAFVRHLAGCAACAEIVGEAAASLEDDADAPRTPRAEDAGSLARVRERLLRSLEEDPEASPSPPLPAGPAWLRAALAAALAALVVGGGAWLAHRRAIAPLIESRDRLVESQGRLGERIARLEAENARLAELDGEVRARLDRALREVDLLRADDLIEVPLAGVPSSSPARARILWQAKTQRCFMTARGLPLLPAGRLYVMWVVTASGRTILVGSFASDVHGDAVMYGQLPEGTEAVNRVVITDEPVALPATPSGTEHLAWSRQT